MKKLCTLLIASALLAGACNKNKKFNKTLDGSWITVMKNGQAVPASDAYRFAFSKDGKDDGKVTVTVYDSGTVQATYAGTYKVSDKGKTLTMDGVDSQDQLSIHTQGSVTDQDDKKFTYNATIDVTSTGALGFSTHDAAILVLNKE